MKKVGQFAKVLFFVFGAVCLDARHVAACAAEAFEEPVGQDSAPAGQDSEQGGFARQQLLEHIMRSVEMGKEAYFKQLVALLKGFILLQSQLFDLGYTGDKKKEIYNAIKSNASLMERLFERQNVSGHDASLKAAQEHMLGQMLEQLFMASSSVVLSLFQQQSTCKRTIDFVQEAIMFLICHRNYSGLTAYASVRMGKLCLALLRSSADMFDQEPEKMQQFVQRSKELKRQAEKLNQSSFADVEPLLRNALGLANEEHAALLNCIIDINSHGFVRLLRVFSLSGTYDVNRVDDSGETLLDWARRMELPLVVDGINEMMQQS